MAKVDATSNVEYYYNYISDIEYERNKNKIANNVLSLNKKGLGWKHEGGAKSGSLRKLRVVTRTHTTHNQSFLFRFIGFFCMHH